MSFEYIRLLRRHDAPGGRGQPHLPDIGLDHNLPPDFIPESYMKTIDELRSQGWISKKPVMAIINYHSEAALEIQGTGANIDLAKVLKSVHTSNRSKVLFNPSMESVDFYVIDNGNKVSQRLRISFLGGQVHSCRTITIVGNHPEIEVLERDGESFSLRKECVFIEREDMQRQNQNTQEFRRFVEDFFEKHKKGNRQIHAVVSKSSRYAKVPDDMDWHHVKAVKKDTGADLTNTESIYGMSPYLNLVIQEVIKALDLERSSIDFVKKIALYLLNGQYSPEAFIVDNLGENHQKIKRIELEYRGDQLKREAVHLLHQITSALKQSNLSFEQIRHRKINPLGEE